MSACTSNLPYLRNFSTALLFAWLMMSGACSCDLLLFSGQVPLFFGDRVGLFIGDRVCLFFSDGGRLLFDDQVLPHLSCLS